MKQHSIGPFAAAAMGPFLLVLLLVGSPGTQRPTRPQLEEAATPAEAPEASAAVSENGFTLVSQSIDLPADDAQLLDGPHADVANANCTACHSASMILSQPKLSADQWKATVTKMREAYKAPVRDADVPLILTYLTALSEAKGGAPKAAAQDPDPRAAPRIGGAG